MGPPSKSSAAGTLSFSAAVATLSLTSIVAQLNREEKTVSSHYQSRGFPSAITRTRYRTLAVEVRGRKCSSW